MTMRAAAEAREEPQQPAPRRRRAAPNTRQPRRCRRRVSYDSSSDTTSEDDEAVVEDDDEPTSNGPRDSTDDDVHIAVTRQHGMLGTSANNVRYTCCTRSLLHIPSSRPSPPPGSVTLPAGTAASRQRCQYRLWHTPVPPRASHDVFSNTIHSNPRHELRLDGPPGPFALRVWYFAEHGHVARRGGERGDAVASAANGARYQGAQHRWQGAGDQSMGSHVAVRMGCG